MIQKWAQMGERQPFQYTCTSLLRNEGVVKIDLLVDKWERLRIPSGLWLFLMLISYFIGKRISEVNTKRAEIIENESAEKTSIVAMIVVVHIRVVVVADWPIFKRERA